MIFKSSLRLNLILSDNNMVWFRFRSDLAWKNYEVTMTTPNILTLRDILNDTTDVFELKDDVVLWSFQYGFLVAASQSQCFIFKENNWNCAITVDLRDKCPQFLKQFEKYIIFASFTKCLKG